MLFSTFTIPSARCQSLRDQDSKRLFTFSHFASNRFVLVPTGLPSHLTSQRPKCVSAVCPPSLLGVPPLTDPAAQL